MRADDPQAVKLMLPFEVIPQPQDRHRLKTETFIHCPTPGVKARFGCYWAAIRPASGVIRRGTLLLVQRHLAEVI